MVIVSKDAKRDEKKNYLIEADHISYKISLRELNLITGTKSLEERKLLKDEISDLTKRYWNIEKMRIFPLDTNLFVKILLGTGFELSAWIDILINLIKIWQQVEK